MSAAGRLVFPLLIAIAMSLPGMSTAQACDYCLSQQGISPLETQRRHGLRITQRHALNDSVYTGSDEIVNPGVEEDFRTTDLSAFFCIPSIDGLLLTVNAPVRRTRQDGHLHLHEDGEMEVEADRGAVPQHAFARDLR